MRVRFPFFHYSVQENQLAYYVKRNCFHFVKVHNYNHSNKHLALVQTSICLVIYQWTVGVYNRLVVSLQSVGQAPQTGMSFSLRESYFVNRQSAGLLPSKSSLYDVGIGAET